MYSEQESVDVNPAWDNRIMKNGGQKEEDEHTSFVDNKILRMMRKMGYQSGFGLGKNQQGTTLPIEVKQQLGKRGLGLKIENLHCSDDSWDFSQENINVVEKVEWLQNDSNFQVVEDEIFKWQAESSPNHKIEEECNFCDKEALLNVLNAKNIFDELDLKELSQARAKANPFETIRSVFFMNRAALKMANIDAATDFMFTNIDRNAHHKNNKEPFYFADVCAGPGGFTEYILWRKKWHFKGFGLTLRDENDFKITDSNCASSVTFLPLYGAKGDGNICCPENIFDFKEKVLHETGNKGVHFVMADGGFSVEGNENIQEILSKKIYIAQCLTALEILRQHGHFVTKVFDLFTCFSVGLIYLMYNCFEKVCILKPNSSRPANSERYLICCNFKSGECVQTITSYIRHLVNRLWHLKDNKELDITEIVPLAIMKNDSNFYFYIYDSNNRFAKNQTVSLQKLAAFCRNPHLIEFQQEQLRKKCLEYWQIPDKPRLPISKYTVSDLLFETINKKEILLIQPRELHRIEDLGSIVSDIKEWHFTPMTGVRNTNVCNFYAGVGVSKAYRLQCDKWIKVKNLQLTRGTLLYGEWVKETIVPKSSSHSENQEQHRYSLHVIDALRLGDVTLADLKFEERINLIEIYCKAVNHEFRQNAIRIRSKAIYKLETLSINMPLKENKTTGNFVLSLPILGCETNEESYKVNSILLLKTNENQSFHSTYVLRVQLFINQLEDNKPKPFSVQALLNFIKQKGS